MAGSHLKKQTFTAISTSDGGRSSEGVSPWRVIPKGRMAIWCGNDPKSFSSIIAEQWKWKWVCTGGATGAGEDPSLMSRDEGDA